MRVTRDSLSEFVAHSDSLGGPNHPATLAFWADFEYVPSAFVDTSTDALTSTYFAQMGDLYREISGRDLNAEVNELTYVDVEGLVYRESPYAEQAPSDRALHYYRLSRALRAANLPKGAHVLDMGCGWGLSSEFLAQLGYKVTAVDINPAFVELVSRRAKRLGLDITTKRADFLSAIQEGEKFDGVLFYECFHHAFQPVEVIRQIGAALRPEGAVILAGEPIQDLWWPGWGLRLDALSVYCIRKYGWFESGWSRRFLSSGFLLNDLIPQFYDDGDADIGIFAIGRKSWTLSSGEFACDLKRDDWWLEGAWAVSNKSGSRSSRLSLRRPARARRVSFLLMNYSPHSIDLTMDVGGQVSQAILTSGANEVAVDFHASVSNQVECNFNCDPWVPSEVIGNGDGRHLGFHLQRIKFEH